METPKKRKPLHPLIAIPVLLFAGLMMLPDLDTVWAGLPDDSWPTAVATVAESNVESHTQHDTNSYSSYTRHLARITYRYEHESQRYESGFWTTSGSLSFDQRDDAQALVDAHPVGSTLTVHVNPKVPTRAVVDTATPESFGNGFWRGGLFGAIGLVMLVSLIVQRRRSTAAPS